MSNSPQQRGREFEAEICQEFGARESIASGSLWFDKLDGSGKGYTLSSKYTDAASFSISQSLIDEAVKHTQGMGGDGSTPIWVIRLQEKKYDLIVMRKDDFMQFIDEPTMIQIEKKASASDKIRAARKPILMREEDGPPVPDWLKDNGGDLK